MHRSNWSILAQGDEVVGKLIELGCALERSAFSDFWKQAAGCKDLLASGAYCAPIHGGSATRWMIHVGVAALEQPCYMHGAVGHGALGPSHVAFLHA